MDLQYFLFSLLINLVDFQLKFVGRGLSEVQAQNFPNPTRMPQEGLPPPSKSTLRSGYGLLFEEQGYLYHSLQRCYYFMGIKLPTLSDLPDFPILRTVGELMHDCESKQDKPIQYQMCRAQYQMFQYFVKAERNLMTQLIYTNKYDLKARFPNLEVGDIPVRPAHLDDMYSHFDFNTTDITHVLATVALNQSYSVAEILELYQSGDSTHRPTIVDQLVQLKLRMSAYDEHVSQFEQMGNVSERADLALKRVEYLADLMRERNWKVKRSTDAQQRRQNLFEGWSDVDEEQAEVLSYIQASEAEIETIRKLSESPNNAEDLMFRYKRWAVAVAKVVETLFSAATSYHRQRQMRTMRKAISLLDAKTHRLDYQVDMLEHGMMAISKVSNTRWKYARRHFKRQAVHLARMQGALRREQLRTRAIQDQMSEIQYHQYELLLADQYLMTVVGTIYPHFQRALANYQKMLQQSNNIMLAADSLADKRLSPLLISPAMLQDYLGLVKAEFQREYPTYELVLDQAHHYYRLPLVEHQIAGDMLVIQLPMLFKHYQSGQLSLFALQQVPVPYDITVKLPPSLKGNYTQLRLTSEYLAMSDAMYLPLSEPQLRGCHRVTSGYFCEQLFLQQQAARHTCESAIYHNRPAHEINELCEFDYLHQYQPRPQILDGGNEVLIANCPVPWTFSCKHGQHIPTDVVAAPYITLHKSALCRCSVAIGPYVLRELLTTCPAEGRPGSTEVKTGVSVNQAVYNNMEEWPSITDDIRRNMALVKSVSHMTNPLLPSTAGLSPLPVADIIEAADPDVLDLEEPQSEELDAVMDSISSGKPLYGSKSDKALAMDDIQVLASKTGTLTFMFYAAVISMPVIFITLILLCVCYQFRKEVNERVKHNAAKCVKKACVCTYWCKSGSWTPTPTPLTVHYHADKVKEPTCRVEESTIYAYEPMDGAMREVSKITVNKPN